MPNCQHCTEPLTWDPVRGWTHPQGGSYMMRCKDCGYQAAPYPSPSFCPKCGSRRFVDDHCALPIAELSPPIQADEEE